MDELSSVLTYANSRPPDAPITRDQFVGLVQRLRTELTFLRNEVAALSRRVEQFDKGKKP